MVYLTFIEGEFEEAEKLGRIAINLEPLSAIDHADLAWTLHTANKFEEALAAAKIGIELDANSFLSHRLAGLCYIALQRLDEAIDILEYLSKISNNHPHAVTALIWAYCSNGNMEEGTKLMNKLIETSAGKYIGTAFLGISYAYLGDLNKAIDDLEKAFNEYDVQLYTFKYSPFVPVELRNDPRFKTLFDRVCFPK